MVLVSWGLIDTMTTLLSRQFTEVYTSNVTTEVLQMLDMLGTTP